MDMKYLVIDPVGEIVAIGSKNADSFPAAVKMADYKTRTTGQLHTIRPVELVRLPSAS